MSSAPRISFRVKALLTTLLLQAALTLLFVLVVPQLIAARTAAAIRANLSATAEGYARNAAFVFIGTLDANRTEFLHAATQNQNLEAAFLRAADGRIITLTDEAWRPKVERLPPNGHRSTIADVGAQWVATAPVFASCEQERESCTNPELLGFVGLIGDKALVSSLNTQVFVVIGAASVALLVTLALLTNALSYRLYAPMRRLADDVEATASSDFRSKLQFKGPIEVEAVASSINQLIDRATESSDRLQQRVYEKTKEEREAREQAEEARALAEKLKEWRTELMAVNTHELLTPLRILLGELDRAHDEVRFLAEGRTKDSIAERLDAMKPPIARIEEIVEQLNLALRIEEGRIEVELSDVDVAAIAERVRDQLAPEASRKGNVIIVETRVNGSVRTDGRMIEKIISNIVSNAVKFTRNGTIRVDVEHCESVLKIRCADTGVGIPAEKRARIFEPLYQADMSSRRVADGLGLGLSIVKGYVSRLGGSIDIESAAPAGTVFEISIPVSSKVGSPGRISLAPMRDDKGP